ncbi:MAG: ATP-binding protein [Thermoguttaceae bacterium]|nr:ATP-binding protein [Thermoguttaceae bacterium]
MIDDELVEIIELLRRRGTDFEFVETKKARRALPKRLWETLSAFGNQRGGGVIVLGLDESDGFAATGVQDVKKAQSDLASLCDEMEPPLRPVIRVHDFEGQQLVVAEVPEVGIEQKPCHYRGSGLYTGSFVRVADGNRQMSQYEVHALLENRDQPRHDIEIVEGAVLDDLDGDLLAHFVRRVRKRRPKLAGRSDGDILRQMHVLDAEGKATLAGVLCFARHPQQWFPSLTITFLHYPGTRSDELGPRGERFLDNRRFDGPLTEALDDALDTVVGAMRKRNLIQGLIRQEIPEYPPDAVREALVNAVAHRDLSRLAQGSQVQIQMYRNRLEVQNPGGLFGPVNEDNLGDPAVQAARNQFLMQMLEDLGPAENRGTGIGTMVRATREAQTSPPEFEDHRTYFRVILSNDTMLDDATVEWLNQFQALDLSENQRLALAYTLHQQEISNGIYCRLTGADSRAATLELQDLVRRGLLQQIGTRRWTTYSLSPKAAETPEEERRGTAHRRMSPVDRQERIVQLISGHATMSARAIGTELSIPRATVNYDLKKLVEGGRIERTTKEPQDKRAEYRVLSKSIPS